MVDPFRILLPTLATLFHERHDLVLENLLLRDQLQIASALGRGRASRAAIDSYGLHCPVQDSYPYPLDGDRAEFRLMHF